jgi:hypothetical protein
MWFKERHAEGLSVNTDSASNIQLHTPGSWWLRPREADRPPLYWHIVSRAFAFGMWAVPQRYRFDMARRCVTVLRPIVKRTSWYRGHELLGIDGVEEIALHYALNIMTRSGLLFDLKMKVEGAEVLRTALQQSGGTIIVAPHALLSLSLFRYLHDLNCRSTIVSAAPLVHIYGTRFVTRAMQPSSSLFIRLRTVLRRGELVCAMIDAAPRSSARTIQFATSSRPVFISDALIKLAKRCHAGVIFTAARLDHQRQLVLTFAAPPAGSEASDLSITKGFVTFLEDTKRRGGQSRRRNNQRGNYGDDGAPPFQVKA